MASHVLILLVVALNVIQKASSGESIPRMSDGTMQPLNTTQEVANHHGTPQAEQEFAEENTPDKACYRDIGCFYKNGTFKHLRSLPDSPDMIRTGFALYTRGNSKLPVSLHYLNSSSIFDPTFDPKKKLKIICHGFTMSGDNSYIIEMKDALLNAMDCNVIVIDWRRGAFPPFYVSAALDTELVGRQVGRLLSLLVEKRGLQATDVHIIGFSLGAHLSGFAGKWLKKEYGYAIGRISALDPASFLFEGRGDDVIVNSKDALFVDVMHTSSGSSILSGELGMTEAVGHVDFYPNGGKQQPRCSGIICNHMRALDLFTGSIDGNCEFRAVACESYDLFDDGGCFQSKTKQMGRMGYYSNAISGRGTLYLATTGSKPFCGTSILVTISVSAKQHKTYGAVAISMIAPDGTEEILNITDSRSQTINPKEVLKKQAVVNPSVFPLSKVHVHYVHYKGWFYTGTNSFLFDHMKVLDEAGHVWFERSIHGTEVSSAKSKVFQA